MQFGYSNNLLQASAGLIQIFKQSFDLHIKVYLYLGIICRGIINKVYK